ncbi:MAG TPA: c-type cytochrome [Paraburkholderia sp.]|uniref:c-type cytochrome n=1 Tax=Paraburkholderia sp. TaxID=1926495 RepID=UPI002B7433FA|nr:c-type cytochrome [Paraburkholderia sp.]HTR08893.1 c-type cytochrome [Paraburkholderia sp.]
MKRKSQAKNKTATLAAALAISALGALTFGAAPARAQDAPTGLALAQQQNCMSCHSVTRTFMGPPLRDIAAKYAGKPEAQTYLTHKILEGSSGVWGTVPMPANTQLNPGQAATLANWILTLK